MDKNELWKLYYQKDKEFEAAKTKRSILTILGFAVFYFVVLYFIEKPTGLDILGNVIFALIIAGIHFFVNAIVFGHLTNKGRAESEALNAIKKQIDNIE